MPTILSANEQFLSTDQQRLKNYKPLPDKIGGRQLGPHLVIPYPAIFTFQNFEPESAIQNRSPIISLA